MKKRIMCLALTVVMLISVFAFSGCSSEKTDDDVVEDASRSTKTLNMYVMTEANTDKESTKAVEEEINKILKSKFKTKVNISYFTEDEYYEALEASFAAKEEEAELADRAAKLLKKYVKEHKEELGNDGAKKKFYEEYPEYQKYQETTTDPTEETTVEETVYNEDTGLLELKYPEADPNVVDIFYISGYERYVDYIEKEWIARVDDELNSSSKKLKTYVSDVFMNSVKYEGGTYAIPNNRTIGEYTYMLLNKRLLAKYYYNASSFATLTDCKAYLEDVEKYEKDIVPIDGAPDLYNVLFWNIDPETLEIDTNKFSIIGTTYTPTSTLGTNLQFTSLFASKKAYRDQLLTNKEYEEKNYFRSNVPENAECAIKIVTGGAELEKKYGDEYEMIILESPMASYDTLFGSMFAVGGYSNEVNRSMEIITYINTNPELRNLLQYGIENVNYTLDLNGQVNYTSDNKYWMDINKTGNTFITYTQKGMDPDIWKYGMKQNRDATVDMILGFTLKDAKVDTNGIKAMIALSEATQKRIDECKTYDELSKLIDDLSIELKAQSNTDIKNYVNVLAEPDADGNATPYVLFYEWMTDMGFIKEE